MYVVRRKSEAFSLVSDSNGESFFDESVVKQAVKGARRSTEELRASAAEGEETQMLPAFMEMMMAMRKQLWEESDVDALGLYMKGVYIAAALSFDTGLRPGQVRLADGPLAEDHCLRAGDFQYRVCDGEEERRVRGGEELRAFLNQAEGNLKKVMGVDIA